jgi:hypothetical protein
VPDGVVSTARPADDTCARIRADSAVMAKTADG